MFVNMEHDFPKRVAYKKGDAARAPGLDRRGAQGLDAHRVPDEAGRLPAESER